MQSGTPTRINAPVSIKNRRERRNMEICFPRPVVVMPTLPTLPAGAGALKRDLKKEHALLEPVEEPSAPVFEDINDPSLTQAVLLNWLGQQPVTFHRLYVDITGNVLSALWVSHILSYLAKDTNAVNSDGVFSFEVIYSNCTSETGLSALEQRKCQQTLESLDLLVVESSNRSRVKCHLRLQRLAELMLEHSTKLGQSIAQQTNAPDPDVLDAKSRASKRRKSVKSAA